MSIQQSAAQLVTLASEGGEGGHHMNLNPLLPGLGAFVILMLLLFITVSFNRDR
ncbi:hypothetical protein [Streptomyces fragilis]|uniref:Secreted protein n=1 Tax=Streptomyces fragilis TaxID=67301 RepID=A0ABV2YNS6_9ACTN|nr:hypothetical protein [Streptomyces fragilis]